MVVVIIDIILCTTHSGCGVGTHICMYTRAWVTELYCTAMPCTSTSKLSLTLCSHAEGCSGCLQNASLSVMTQNQIWSMHSTDDSLWGDDDVVAPLDDDAPQPPETWLMLEFCDRGSLLVCSTSLRLLWLLPCSTG